MFLVHHLLLFHALACLLLAPSINCSHDDRNYDADVYGDDLDRVPRFFRRHHNSNKHAKDPQYLEFLRSIEAVNSERSEAKRLERIGWNLDKNCGKVPTRRRSPYISGGLDARPGDFPGYVYTVTMSFNRDGEIQYNHCGGVILSPYHILTAAHCGHKERLIGIKVWPTAFRPFDLSPYTLSQFYDVELRCPSADFNGVNNISGLVDLSQLDMAVYKLRSPIEFNQEVQSACLPKQSLPYGVRVAQVGLGMVAEPAIFPQRLQYGVYQREECILPNYICMQEAEGRGGSVCAGDSGGPALAIEDGKVVVYGIITSGESTCDLSPGKFALAADTYTNRQQILLMLDTCR